MTSLQWIRLALGAALTVPLSIPAIAQVDPSILYCNPDDPSRSAAFNIFESGLLESDPNNTVQADVPDVLIPTEHPLVFLDASLFVPEGPAPADGYPLIVMPAGWGQKKNQYNAWIPEFKERGYMVITYANRGFPASGGQADVAGPGTRGDVSRAIDWVEANYPVGKVGIAGVSYGGGLALLGSIEDPRIETAAALASWADLRYDLYPNDTVNCVWGSLLLSANNLIPEVGELWNNIRNHQNLDDVDEFLRLRSPINRIDELNARKVPTLFAHSYGDYLFKPNRVIDLYNQFEGPKKLLLNPGTHGISEAHPIFGRVPVSIWNNVYRWFDHHLLGIDNGIDDEKKVIIARRWEDSRPREGYDTFPPKRNKRYYLHPRPSMGIGTLSSGKYNGVPTGNVFGNGDNTIAETGGVPVVSEVLELFGLRSTTSVPLDNMRTHLGIQYATPELDSLLRIRGNPNLKLFVRPWAQNIQLHAYLFHVDPNTEGRGHLISHVPISLHDVQAGVMQKIEVDFFTTSYNVPAGHTLRLAIDTEGLHYEAIKNEIFLVQIPYRKVRQSVLKVPFVRLGDFTTILN